MSIREAKSSDLEAIVAIYNATIPGRSSTADLEPLASEARREWLERRSSRRPVWVIEEEGAVLAWLSLDDYKHRAAYDISAEVSVYVHERARRRGHARALLRHALAAAPGLGLERILAVVFAHNAGSLALFESLGFERWGLLPGVTRLDGRATDVAILGMAL